LSPTVWNKSDFVGEAVSRALFWPLGSIRWTLTGKNSSDDEIEWKALKIECGKETLDVKRSLLLLAVIHWRAGVG